MKKKSTIETERIILREFKLGDEYEMFSNWASDPEVVKYLTWPIHENIEVTRSIIQSWVNQYQDPTTIRFGITLKDTGELVGGIDVVHYFDGVPEVGYCMAKKCWNKGIMTEVFSAFRDYLFTLGFKKITIRAEVPNIGSNRVIQKCGFKFVETVHLDEPRSCDVNCYELSRILETEKLVLRPMSDSDYKSL